MKETANQFIHTNQEYEKLKKGDTSGKTPRETPSGQGPGRSGYGKQMFDEWTIEEIRDYAVKLGVDNTEDLDRETLLETIENRDATRARTTESGDSDSS